MKSNELSQSLITEENFFEVFKLLAIVGSAAGGLFCLYSYLNSGNTSSDKTPLNNKINNENKGQTFAQNFPKISETATFISPDPNTKSDGQLAIIDQQPGTTGSTFYTTNNITTNNTTNIGGFYFYNAFVSDGLPKEHDGELKNLIVANFKTIQQLQQKVEELAAKLAQQEKENHTLDETINSYQKALNIIALYAFKVNMEQCDMAKHLIAIREVLAGRTFTIEDGKEYLENMQNEILKETKELFGESPALFDTIESIVEDEKTHLENIQNETLEEVKEPFVNSSTLPDAVELSGQTSEHSDSSE